MSFIDQLFHRANEKAQNLLLAALDQAAQGVIVADAEGELIYVNPAAATMHGVYSLHVGPEDYSETYHLLTAEGEPYPSEEVPLAQTVRTGATVRDAHWKIARPDGVVIDAIGTSRPVRDGVGQQIGSVLTISDRTRELADRAQRDAALMAKDALLHEVNHRVENNLTLVMSLLSLHARRMENAEARTAFSDASARVGVLVDIHRQLYTLGTHRDIEVVAFLAHIARETVQSLSAKRDVALNLREYGAAVLPTDKATPLALALNELVLNSLKHAFAETERPRIDLELTAGSNILSIAYRDNGCGIEPGAGKSATGIGEALIHQLTTALAASFEQVDADQGFAVEIVIPLT